ncbi:MAG: PilZ domain-containing protein [Magnetococcales bacterium]|nr:PilZ domain-containing protein [Magnetococcales bacterium]
MSTDDATTDTKRRYERLSCYDAATLSLSKERIIEGKVQDMGFGGYSFVTEDMDFAGIELGDECAIEVQLFGRPTQFDCVVAHISNKGIGLRIPRLYSPPDVPNVSESN